MRQFRLVHVGVAVAMMAATVTGVGLVQSAGAVGGGAASVFVPIAPCRLADTRVGGDNVGARNRPIGAGEAALFVVWGLNGNCTIPATATGIATNVTAVNPTASSYLTVYPADVDPRPAASNLNLSAGSPPIPNQVTVGLSAAGAVDVFNNSGSVDVIIDIVGYYQTLPASGTGPQGPAGPTGTPGTPGAPAAEPARVIWVSPNGGDFTTINLALASITDNDSTHRYLVKVGPGTFIEPAGIDLKNFVDIEGSGEGLTKISVNTVGESPAAIRAGGTVTSTLSDLTVETSNLQGLGISATVPANGVTVHDVTVSATNFAGVMVAFVESAAAPRLTDVTLTGATGPSVSTAVGLVSLGDPVLERVDVSIVGYDNAGSTPSATGIDVQSGAPQLTDVTIAAIDAANSSGLRISSTSPISLERVDITSSAIYDGWALDIRTGAAVTANALKLRGTGSNGLGASNSSATLSIRNSSITGSTKSINTSGGTTNVASSVLGGAVLGTTYKCVAVSSSVFVELNVTCV